MAARQWYVYHIKLEGMGLDQGYVGISVNPVSRWRAHKSRNCNPHLSYALKKYTDKVVYTILGSFDSEEEARWQEYTLRPTKNIGWNVAQGGTKSPILAIGGLSAESLNKIKMANKGRKHSETTKQKISQGNTGKVRSEVCVEAMRLRKGFLSGKAKSASIFKYPSGDLVAQGVVIRQWAKENGLDHSGLFRTLKSDLSKPSRRNNPCHYKGYYARYD